MVLSRKILGGFESFDDIQTSPIDDRIGRVAVMRYRPADRNYGVWSIVYRVFELGCALKNLNSTKNSQSKDIFFFATYSA